MDIKPISNRAWVEINLDSLRSNIENIQLACPDCNIMAVVKANAYGCGAKKISQFLENNKMVQSFAVASLEEGIELRTAGIKSDILVLNHTRPECVNLINKHGLTQSISSSHYAKIINDHGLPIKAHIKLDTGMGRMGIIANDGSINEIISIFNMKNVDVNGLYTHLSVADSNDSEDIKYTQNQIKTIKSIHKLVKAKGYDVEQVHFLNSAGAINYYDSNYSTIRIGIAMYGFNPNYGMRIPFNLNPILTVKCKISMIKNIPVGSYVGYGRDYCATRETKLAVLPIGYADGFNRSLSRINIIVNDVYAPVVGRVSMDVMTIDITDVPDVNYDTIITVLGRYGKLKVDIDEVANKIGTINYELISGISKRLERVYVSNTESTDIIHNSFLIN